MTWGFNKPRRILEEYFNDHFGIKHEKEEKDGKSKKDKTEL